MIAPAPPNPELFAALGDPRRLALFERLRVEGPLSTARLAERVDITRQAVSKHLDVLAQVSLVHDRRVGRERQWSVDPAPLEEVQDWIAQVKTQWAARLDRLDAFLLDNPD